MRKSLLAGAGLLAFVFSACTFDYDFDQNTVLVVRQPGLAIASAATNVSPDAVKSFVDGLSKLGEVESLTVDQAVISVTNAGVKLDGIEYVAIILSNAGRLVRAEAHNLTGTSCGFSINGGDLLYFYSNPPFSVVLELHRAAEAPDFPTNYQVRIKGKMSVEALFKP